MGWQDRLSDTSLRPVFYLVIEGRPWVFASAPSWGWSAPRCARHGTDIPAYTVLYDTLDVRGGIEPFGWRVSELGGISEPAAIELQLVDHKGQLADIFAVDKTTANRTRATDILGWDDASETDARYQWAVESTSDFASSGLLYGFRETCYYDTIASSTIFGADPEDAAHFLRGCYAWEWDASDETKRWNLAIRHEFSSSMTHVGELIADHPHWWRGLRVSLRCNFLHGDRQTAMSDEDGTSDWRNKNEFEVFAGVIGDVTVDETGHRWHLTVQPLTSLLDTQIGVTAPSGTIRLPAWDSPPVYVGEGTNTIWFFARIEGTTDTGGTHHVSALPLRNWNGGAQVWQAWMRLTDYMNSVAYTIKSYLQGKGGSWASWPDMTAAVGVENSPEGDETGIYFANFWAEAAPTDSVCSLTFGSPLIAEMGFAPDPALGGSQQTSWSEEGLIAHLVVRQDEIGIPLDQVSARCRLIPFQRTEHDASLGREFEGGHAVLGTGEVVEYSDVISPDDIAPLSALNVPLGGRGALGTGDLIGDIDLSSDSDPEEIRDALGIDQVPVWTMLLRLAVSTGLSDHHGDYDQYPPAWGARLDPSLFDIDSFQALTVESEASSSIGDPIESRTLALTEPQSLREMFEREARFSQVLITPRLCPDGWVRIGAYRLDDAAQCYTSDTITTLRVKPVASRTRVINQVCIPTLWQPGKARFIGPTLEFINDQSVNAYGKTRRVKLEVPGFAVHWQTGWLIGALISERLFWRFGREHRLVDVWTSDRSAMLLRPGQTVALTASVSVPTSTGDWGYSGRVATVVQVRSSVWSPDHDYAAEVRLLVGPPQQVSTYAPCAQVTSAASTTLTLANNVYSETYDYCPYLSEGETCRDWKWFLAGYKVRIWNDGEYDSAEDRTIQTNNDDGTIVIDSALTLTPGSNCTISWDDWDDQDSDQQLFAAISDNSSLGASSDTAYEYV